MADAQDLNIVLFESGWLLRCMAALATYAIAGSAPALAEEAFVPDLCVLPIKNSTVEAARALARPGERFIDNYPASSTLAHQVTMIPGVPKPVICPWFETDHAWTVSEDNAFEAMPGPFPGSSLYDKFVVEIGTGRVLGLGYKGVYAFDPGTGQFRLIVPTATTRPGEAVNAADFQTVRTIVHVERLGLTLIGTDHGVFQLLGDRVQPLAGAGKREVGTVMGIIDLPVHHALMLAGGNGAGAMIRHDDGSIEQLVTTGAELFRYPDYVITARESRLPGRIVVRAAQRLLEVEMRPNPAGFSPVRVTELISERKNLTVGGLVTSAGGIPCPRPSGLVGPSQSGAVGSGRAARSARRSRRAVGAEPALGNFQRGGAD